MKTEKKRMRQSLSSGVALFGCAVPVSALAVNLNVTGGWPCNVSMSQPGVAGAVANFADFNFKENPSATTQTRGVIYGEVSDYLSSIGKTFQTLISQLPFLEPLSYNLASDAFGARLGIDVCIPPEDRTRDDVLDWTVTVSSLGPLIPPAEGDWFTVTTPKVEAQVLASNCNTPVDTPMSTTSPIKAGSCAIFESPALGLDRLNFSGQSLTYKFKKIISRDMVVRFSLTEQSKARRPHRLDAGTVLFDFVDPPLPPLTVEDLLGKQLFFAPETDLVAWPGCASFSSVSGLAFAAMNLQGPNSSLDLRWTGEDTDCTKQSGCSDGNKGGKNFSFPVSVYLGDGSLAPANTSPSTKVSRFQSVFNDFSFSGENAFPGDGKIQFDSNVDQVYRSSSKAFFSSTISRWVAPGQWKTCRVWFKRDNGFDCTTLPNAHLREICTSM